MNYLVRIIISYIHYKIMLYVGRWLQRADRLRRRHHRFTLSPRPVHCHQVSSVRLVQHVPHADWMCTSPPAFRRRPRYDMLGHLYKQDRDWHGSNDNNTKCNTVSTLNTKHRLVLQMWRSHLLSKSANVISSTSFVQYILLSWVVSRHRV